MPFYFCYSYVIILHNCIFLSGNLCQMCIRDSMFQPFGHVLDEGEDAGDGKGLAAEAPSGAEQNGLLASLNSVAKLPYEYALDGISNTQTINPSALGNDDEQLSLIHI